MSKKKVKFAWNIFNFEGENTERGNKWTNINWMISWEDISMLTKVKVQTSIKYR